MKYKARCGELTPRQLAEFDGTGYSEKFIRLLLQRGIDSKAKAEKFFDYDLDKLHDPFLLKGMREAVERMKTAISQKEQILIIGDYDADGICSTAILYKYFISKKARTAYFLPKRDADGYGLNIELIKKLHEKYNPKLIITVDCGISCPKEIELAKELGIDCIVTDHHAIPSEYPDCICVDPKFTDQKYPFSDLCGAGVALKVVHAMEGLEVAKKYLDICAIATVADIVSLTDENRIIVHHGLKMLNTGSVPGLTALAKACNIRGEIKSSDISYRLCPKINASGRMGNAKKGLDVILEKIPAKIEKTVKDLLFLNVKRQELCVSIYNDAVKMIEKEGLQNNNIIVIAKPSWESGVLGIIAARLTDRYGKPSIVLGGRGEVYKGSGRSVNGIDLVQCVSMVSQHLISYGGHTMATGLSVAVDKYKDFVDSISHVITGKVTKKSIDADKYYDFEVTMQDLNPQFIQEVKMLEPTGCDNAAPVFMTVARRTLSSALAMNSPHLRFEQDKVKFMFFGGASFNEILLANCEKSIIFELQQVDSSTPKAIVKCVIPFVINEEEKALVLERYLHRELATSPDQAIIDIVSGLSVDRQVFINYYKAIIMLTESSNSYASLPRLFNRLRMTSKDIFQFVFCFSVFRELGIIEINRHKIIINTDKSTELNNSLIYNIIKNK